MKNLTRRLPTVSPDLGLLAMRLMAGTVFAFHGSQKLFGFFGGHGISGTAGWMESIGIPFGTLSAVAAGTTEFVGGLALIAGLGLRWLGLPLAFTMLVAAFSAHTGFDVQKGGMEYPLVLAALSFGLAATGPGRFALGSRRSESALLAPAP
jgi:putative oxidoreductase